MILGIPWPKMLGGVLIYVGLLAMLIEGEYYVFDRAFQLPSLPSYEYRLVPPSEAIQLVNEEGWRVSERIRMTDQAVYIYRSRSN